MLKVKTRQFFKGVTLGLVAAMLAFGTAGTASAFSFDTGLGFDLGVNNGRITGGVGGNTVSVGADGSIRGGSGNNTVSVGSDGGIRVGTGDGGFRVGSDGSISGDIAGIGSARVGSDGSTRVRIPGVGSVRIGADGSVSGNVFGFGFGSGGAGGCGGFTMGAVICNVVESSKYLPSLFTGVAYMFGLILAFWGILKLQDHVLNPNQTPLSDAMKRFIAGGAFFALPIVLEAAYNTVALDIDGHESSDFNVSTITGGGLDAMITAMMADIWTPIHWLLGGFCYLAGIVLVIIGISRMLKSAQEGPRGPGGLGTIMTFLVGGALLSADAMMGAFSSSLFMDNQVAVHAEMAFQSGMDGAELDHIHNVISAVLAFLMVVGWVSFIRGWFIVREVAEGSQQASLMAGMTHIFGGALAVNLGPVLNAVQETFGITGYGITFT